jgi:hypothetical protein
MATLDYRPAPRRHRRSFLRLWALYALGYMLLTPVFAGTEELWGESLNDVFVGVASLFQYATARAGWVSDWAFFWIGLPLNAFAYGLGFAAFHRWLGRGRGR